MNSRFLVPASAKTVCDSLAQMLTLTVGAFAPDKCLHQRLQAGARQKPRNHKAKERSCTAGNRVHIGASLPIRCFWGQQEVALALQDPGPVGVLFPAGLFRL